jgi:hypothetical protein
LQKDKGLVRKSIGFVERWKFSQGNEYEMEILDV